MNGFFSTGGGGICGANPFDLMELDAPDAARFVLHLSNDVPFNPPDIHDDASPSDNIPVPGSKTISGTSRRACG